MFTLINGKVSPVVSIGRVMGVNLLRCENTGAKVFKADAELANTLEQAWELKADHRRAGKSNPMVF